MKRFGILLFAVALAGAQGCIRSQMRITSDPAGAMVTVNDEYRGRTPIEIPFIWHWYYQIGLEREGYEKTSEIVRLRTRPWLIEPLGFFAEALPFRISDTRNLHFVLKPENPETAE